MAVRTLAWLVCDGCKCSTACSALETVAEAREDVKGLWGRRLNGVNGDFCSKCKKSAKGGE